MCRLGAQILDGLNVLHNEHIVHCDLKPENFAIGLEDPSRIYLIDFGLSKTMPENVQTLVTGKICGSLTYMSSNAHQGIISFQNDIESLAYVLAHLKNGSLPWDLDTLPIKSTDTFDTLLPQVSQLKLNKLMDLLETLPDQIGGILRTSMEMSHNKKPDFKKLKQIILYGL